MDINKKKTLLVVTNHLKTYISRLHPHNYNLTNPLIQWSYLKSIASLVNINAKLV